MLKWTAVTGHDVRRAWSTAPSKLQHPFMVALRSRRATNQLDREGNRSSVVNCRHLRFFQDSVAWQGFYVHWLLPLHHRETECPHRKTRQGSPVWETANHTTAMALSVTVCLPQAGPANMWMFHKSRA
jgi:hypothetical protein